MVSTVSHRPVRASIWRRLTSWLAAAVVFLGIGASVGWAAREALAPVEDPVATTPFTFVEVAEGTVGASILLNTVAQWTPTPAGTNRAVGAVTEIAIAPGDEVGQGATLYRVNERPVVAAVGEIPAYAPIGEGSKGRDVEQLQQLLADLGFYRGPIQGSAGPVTTNAIRSWQQSIDLPETGVVELGDVFFLPELPARVSLDEAVIARGAMLAGGEPAIRTLPQVPAFTLPVTEAQASLMPQGTRVEITAPGGAIWQAIAADRIRDAQTGNVVVRLEAPDGGAICRDNCTEVPVTAQAQLASRIITVEEASGLVAPTAALVTGADGSSAVVDADGARIPVTVVVSARGMSVVEGVAAGTRVRVPPEAP